VLILVNVPDFITVKKEYGDIPPIEVDRNQIQHALSNLANNAIMAMKGNGELIFRTGKYDGSVFIEVEDTGPGISSDQRDLIFEPLYSSKPKGTGLGLPIAKMMIENNEGKIDFDSTVGKVLFSEY